MAMKRATALLFVAALIPGAVQADGARPPGINDIGLDQRLDEQVPLDLVFRDETDRPVRLGDYCDGRPVMLVLAYYGCPMLCTQVLNGLVDSLRRIPFDAGDAFQVVDVDFDSHARPGIAAAKKAFHVV